MIASLAFKMHCVRYLKRNHVSEVRSTFIFISGKFCLNKICTNAFSLTTKKEKFQRVCMSVTSNTPTFSRNLSPNLHFNDTQLSSYFPSSLHNLKVSIFFASQQTEKESEI